MHFGQPCVQHSFELSDNPVSACSLATILKISQNAGVLLRPHVPLLVVALLESLSGLEPQYLNYLSLHAASSQVTQDSVSWF